MEEIKVKVIEISKEDISNYKLVKIENYSSNKNYLGHNENNIPVLINTDLKKGEIKNIMNNSEYKMLPVGKYRAYIVQVYDKIPSEDKELTILELEVRDQKDRQYITFFKKGYNEQQMEISTLKLNNIISMFEINAIEEMVGKEVSLEVKENNKGFINYYIFPLKNFCNWNSDIEVPCTIIKFYKTRDTNKYSIIVKIDLMGVIYDDIVTLNGDNEYDQKSLQWFYDKTKLSIDDMNKDISIPAIFKVVKKPNLKEEGKFYYNKKITWPKTPMKPKTSFYNK